MRLSCVGMGCSTSSKRSVSASREVEAASVAPGPKQADSSPSALPAPAVPVPVSAPAPAPVPVAPHASQHAQPAPSVSQMQRAHIEEQRRRHLAEQARVRAAAGAGSGAGAGTQASVAAPAVRADSNAVVQTPTARLLAAIQGGDVGAVQRLVAEDPHIAGRQVAESGLVPLHLAVRNMDGDIVEVLLDAGAKASVPDPDTKVRGVPSWRPARHCRSACCQWRCRVPADASRVPQEVPLLQAAAAGGRHGTRIVQALLDAHADLTARAESGANAFHFAALQCKVGWVVACVEISMQHVPTYAMCFGMLLQVDDTACPPMLQALLSARGGADPLVLTARNERGDTCLHIAARQGSLPGVAALVDALGEDAANAVALRNNAGETPLSVAHSDAIKRRLKPRTHYGGDIR